MVVGVTAPDTAGYFFGHYAYFDDYWLASMTIATRTPRLSAANRARFLLRALGTMGCGCEEWKCSEGAIDCSYRSTDAHILSIL